MDQNTQSGPYNTNNNYNNANTPPKTQYPRRKSSGTVIVGIILILIGTSHIIDTFFPWIFEWLDSGLLFAGAAIIIGFGLLVKK